MWSWAALIGLLVMYVLFLSPARYNANVKTIEIEHFNVPENTTDAFIKVVLSEAQKKRANKYCVRYEVYRSPEDTNLFVVHQVWKTADAKTLHDATCTVHKKLTRFIEDNEIVHVNSLYQSDLNI